MRTLKVTLVISLTLMIIILAVCAVTSRHINDESVKTSHCLHYSFPRPEPFGKLYTTKEILDIFRISSTNLINETAFVFAFFEVLGVKDRVESTVDAKTEETHGVVPHVKFSRSRQITDVMWHELSSHASEILNRYFANFDTGAYPQDVNGSISEMWGNRITKLASEKLTNINESTLFPDFKRDAMMTIQTHKGLRRFVLFHCSQLSNEQANMLAWLYFKIIENHTKLCHDRKGFCLQAAKEKSSANCIAGITAFDLHRIYDQAFESRLSEFVFIASFLGVNQYFWEINLKSPDEEDGESALDPIALPTSRNRLDFKKIILECQEEIDNEISEMATLLDLEFDNVANEAQDIPENLLLAKIDSFINDIIYMARQRRAYPETRGERYEFMHNMCSYVDNCQANAIAILYHANMEPFKNLRSNEIEKWKFFLDVISRKSGLK